MLTPKAGDDHDGDHQDQDKGDNYKHFHPARSAGAVAVGVGVGGVQPWVGPPLWRRNNNFLIEIVSSLFLVFFSISQIPGVCVGKII